MLKKMFNLQETQRENENQHISILQEEFATELKKSLEDWGDEFSRWVRSLPPKIFLQIEALHQPSILNPDQNKNHWKYELTMIRSIIAVKEKVLRFFEVPEAEKKQFLKDLIFMVVVSDIGKAGPIRYNPNHAAAIASIIYNNLILENKHGEEVRKICMQVLNDEVGTIDNTTKWRIITILRINSGFFSIDPLKKIFQMMGLKDKKSEEKLQPQLAEILIEGKALAMPIELAVIIARQIARSNTTDTVKLKEIDKCFKLERREKLFLKQQGFNPETTAIGHFYSQAHINFGKAFLLSLKFELGSRLFESGMLGLRHHFTQSVFPDSKAEVNSFILKSKRTGKLKRDLKLIAFTEMLDKVEAAMHRSPSTNPFSLDDSQKFLETIYSNLKKNYPDDADYLCGIYREVFAAMRQMGIFQKVKELGKA